jgi:hypothetical protein
MPGFAHLTEEDLDAIVALLKTKQAPPKKEYKVDGTELKDPIPEKIQMSPLVIDLKEFATIPPSSEEGQKTRICKLDFRPDTKGLFVVDLRGKLYELTDKGPAVYLDMAKEKTNFIHKPGLATGLEASHFIPSSARTDCCIPHMSKAPGRVSQTSHTQIPLR